MTTGGEGRKDSHEELLVRVTSLVDQLLLPQRVAARVLADLQLIGAREAGDIREVVEPLQSATDRVGKVADRLPGGNPKRG